MEDKPKYRCEVCKLSTNYKNVFDKHLLSKKHIEKNKVETSTKYSHICSKCNKTYTTHSGLWKHQKKCIEANNPNTIQMELTEIETQEQSEEQSQEQSQGQTQEQTQEPTPIVLDEETQTKIKMNIIKILLNHVNRDELNKIIDEIYENK